MTAREISGPFWPFLVFTGLMYIEHVCMYVTLYMYAKTCSKSLHISHGRGVVAALRRNQFDPQIARSARNSLTFPASYLWVKLEV